MMAGHLFCAVAQLGTLMISPTTIRSGSVIEGFITSSSLTVVSNLAAILVNVSPRWTV